MPESASITDIPTVAFTVPVGAFGFSISNDTGTTILFRQGSPVSTSGSTLGIPIQDTQTRSYVFRDALTSDLQINAVRQTGDEGVVIAYEFLFRAHDVIGGSNPGTGGGGGATPGGTDGQVQYNNAGAFGGLTGLDTSGGILQRVVVPGVNEATPNLAGDSGGNYGISLYNNQLYFKSGGTVSVGIYNGGIQTPGTLGFNASVVGASIDTIIGRGGAANTLQQGVNSATPADQTFKGPDGSGPNVVGGAVRIGPGQSTGNATPAIIALQGTASGSSGSTAQTLVDVFSVIRQGVVRISNIPTSPVGLSAGDIWSNAGILTIV